MKKGRAKSLVMQRQYRSQVVRDKSKYRRKSKHKKAPDSGGFFVSFGIRRIDRNSRTPVRNAG